MTGITVEYHASFRTARRPAKGTEPSENKAKPTPPESTGPCRAARLLALAHHVDRLLEAGVLKSHADAARRLGITEGRMTQVMNLLLLSPEIQEAVLTGKLPAGERRLRRAAAEPSWGRQRVGVVGLPFSDTAS